MFLFEQEHEIAVPKDQRRLLTYLSRGVQERLAEDTHPVRFVVTNTEDNRYHCEVGLLSGLEESSHSEPDDIFRFTHRKVENTESFNVVLLVPTGIGADIGGHAGDSTPVARLLASVCDNLITHPNVVNASDINEIPENGLYVEGSIICRLLMGTAGLQPVRSNRVLVIIDAHRDETFVSAAVNSVSAARASFGLQCPRVVQLDPPIKLKGRFASSGRAAGQVEELDNLLQLLDDYREEYDAVALSSVIDVPSNLHMDYFLSEGKMVNPWGGVEAMLTHTVSSLYNVPSAHSPMFESKEIANLDPGEVDARMAAEAVSMTFLQCILKGLHRSPRIVSDSEAMRHQGVLTAADVSCLVIPDGCVGLPTLAALEQGIPVIAVRENQNIMQNNLLELPWAAGQLHIVENYWEAVGVMSALKAGIAPESVRRPLEKTTVEKRVLATETEATISSAATIADSDS
ncbi:DUF3326 domain-containing protein [Acidobacteria bacterium AH-259-D05]|nr:DUF3326 domain-containing protein [Acidobacteria bacterium AH-259-D05]